MRLKVTIFLLFLTIIGVSQTSYRKLYRNVNGPEVPDSILSKNIIGSFYINNGFEERSFIFDSSMRFEQIFTSCVEYYKKVDSGMWKIENKILVLKSSIRQTKFDIVELDNYYFFILPAQRKQFLLEYRSFVKKYKGAAFIKIGDKSNGTMHLTAWQLSKIFYSRTILSFTGT